MRDGLAMLLKLDREVVSTAQDGDGASGYLLKDTSHTEVAAAIKGTKLDLSDRTQAAVLAIKHGVS